MNPVTHALAGWAVANTARLDRRERGLVTLAGILPDFDGLGMVVDAATRHTVNPTALWGTYHHVLGHNLGMALLVTAGAFALSTRRFMTASLVFLSFHVHLLGDLVGARGPEGDHWPIPYLLPFSKSVQLEWSHQWALNAWPNFVITGVLLAFAFCVAWRHGRSPLEFVSLKADAAFVRTLRNRFGTPKP